MIHGISTMHHGIFHGYDGRPLELTFPLLSSNSYVPEAVKTRSPAHSQRIHLVQEELCIRHYELIGALK